MIEKIVDRFPMRDEARALMDTRMNLRRASDGAVFMVVGSTCYGETGLFGGSALWLERTGMRGGWEYQPADGRKGPQSFDVVPIEFMDV